MSERAGHSVIVVPVPGLEDVVRERTARYDASFLSSDPAFTHAHITLLGPWLDDPTDDDLLAVTDVLASEPAFDFALDGVAEFPDGTLHLVPEPAAPFTRMTAHLAAAFPQTPPYEGRYPELVAHLTIDHLDTGATSSAVRTELAGRLPLTARAERVDLQWWGNAECRLLHTWRLGP